mmetsp:Transcript_4110/g.15872  ORF Transcript_4110/g.15872 Transcript_4110/m.15872 type:complete len:206 (-) Transcript_4110:963-1580(-)
MAVAAPKALLDGEQQDHGGAASVRLSRDLLLSVPKGSLSYASVDSVLWSLWNEGEKPAERVKTLPIVLLHGWLDSWRSFAKLVPLLSKHHHTVALSFRGWGEFFARLRKERERERKRETERDSKGAEPDAGCGQVTRPSSGRTRLNLMRTTSSRPWTSCPSTSSCSWGTTWAAWWRRSLPRGTRRVSSRSFSWTAARRCGRICCS